MYPVGAKNKPVIFGKAVEDLLPCSSYSYHKRLGVV